ncbi:hypothetical protein IJJ37_01565 [Candidatus Saccharibacteria bacterium]|nr:hypothetical protein [Candidatus Saccharibacteria bacterium]MBQ6375596.1 hypothetical protein [Candidatus Saccharibacteria bacterium]
MKVSHLSLAYGTKIIYDDASFTLESGDNFRDFPGTLMVVSHNPSFVERIGITRMLIVPSDKSQLALIKNYSRELLDYYYYLNSDLV